MGRDKALIPVEGRALASRVADALRSGGAHRVVCIGGDRTALVGLGLEFVADEQPGSGPLGGLMTALGRATADGATVLVISACDHPDLDRSTVSTLLSTIAEQEPETVLVQAIDEEGNPALLLALRVEIARPAVAAAFDAGLRSFSALRDRVATVMVEGLDPAALRDVDRPADLT